MKILVSLCLLFAIQVRAEEYVETYPQLWKHISSQARAEDRIQAYDTRDVMDVTDSSYPVTKDKKGLPIRLIDNVSNNRWATKIEPEAQEFAVKEAKLMASKGIAEHFMGIAPGGDVAGVGDWYTPQCPTCEGDKGMIVIADAVAYSPKTNRWYRHRTFKYSKTQAEKRLAERTRKTTKTTTQRINVQQPSRRSRGRI